MTCDCSGCLDEPVYECPKTEGAATIVRSVTIGSAADADLCVHSDGYVSSQHARIDQHADGRFTITDLGSTNGTFVRRLGLAAPFKADGIPIELRPGDVVRVGRTEIPWKDTIN